MACSPFILTPEFLIAAAFVVGGIVLGLIAGAIELDKYINYDRKGRARPGTLLELDEKAERSWRRR